MSPLKGKNYLAIFALCLSLCSPSVLRSQQNPVPTLQGKSFNVVLIPNNTVNAGEIFFRRDSDNDGMSDEDETRLEIFDRVVPVEADGSFRLDMQEDSIIVQGVNTLRMVAVDEARNRSPEVVRIFTFDYTSPELSEIEPVSGTLVSTPTISVCGRAFDNLSLANVKVNGISANLSADGRFLLDNVAISEGESELTITATDTAGNIIEKKLGFIADRTPPAAPQTNVSANPTRLSFVLVEGRTERSATIEISGGTTDVTTEANSKGFFLVKVDLRPGSNQLSITAKDSFGNRSEPTQLNVVSNPNLPPPPSGVAFQINAATGNSQRGLAGSELPRPLVAVVTDRTGAPVPDVAVRFSRIEGSGQFVGGDGTFQATTGVDGRAHARYVSGLDAEAEIIQANFAGNTSTAATFVAAVAVPPVNGATSVSGVVLDQNMRALPNVLVRVGGQQTRTGTNGRFKIFNVSAGPHQLLELIGRDQVPFPGRWPNITYDVDVLSGTDNSLGRPLFLPRVNAGVAMPLDENNIVTQDTSYELPVLGGRPPVKVTAKAGTRVIFPPDVTDRRFSVTKIATNRVPMTLEDGLATNLYISVQPSGAVFDPPLEVSFPNMDGLSANSQVLLMRFDHDAGRYVRVGTGHVSADGNIVKSDAGNGIYVGAWHALPPPAPQPEVTVLGHIQVEDNPLFDGKVITNAEAWIEGARAVPVFTLPSQNMSEPPLSNNSSGMILPRLDFRATFPLPRRSSFIKISYLRQRSPFIKIFREAIRIFDI